MAEVIDHEARDRIAQLEVLAREQGSALWGDNTRRDNGLRSDVRKIEDKVGELEVAHRTIVETWRHYRDVERAQTCEGLKALAAYKQTGAEEGEEESEVTVAKIQMKGYVLAAMIPSTISAIVAIVTLYITLTKGGTQ